MAESLDLKVKEGHGQERICFNIGGQHFETYKATLQSFPNTRISNLSSGDPSYCSDKEEYFFDRNPKLFPYILDSFREGEINFPASTPAAFIKSEVKFWGLDEDKLSAFSRLTCAEEEPIFILNKSSNLEDDERRGKNHALWIFLEEPGSSIKAMVWSAFYILILLLSCAVISTMTVLGLQYDNSEDSIHGRNSQSSVNESGITVLKILYILVASFFLGELIIRFAVCPNKLRFFASFFNDIDVLAIIPMFIVGVILVATPQHWMNSDRARVFGYINAAISVLRALRIVKLGEKIPRFQIILLAYKASLKEFLFLILMLIVGIVIFGTIIYWAEESTVHSHFRSIPDAFWYCIVTMTTVGYGDMRPLSPFGKFVGAICAVSGVLVIVLPIPIFVHNYLLYRKHGFIQGGNDKKDVNEARKTEA